MRALQSMTTPPILTLQGTQPLATSRADRVVEDILKILLHLVNPSQEPQLRDDLLSLARSAISVWDSAQIDELKLIISPMLGRTKRSEWRCQKFDPPLSADNYAETDIISSTYPRIYTLFPRVIGRTLSSMAAPPADLPGSWPQSDQEPHTIETCIYAGRGLPEWSALVVKGKEEVVVKERYLREALEKAMKELDARSERNKGHSRNGSMVESVSPLSPSTRWMSEGGRRVVEDEASRLPG